MFFLIVTSEDLKVNLPKIQISEVGHGLGDTIRQKLKIVLFFCHNHAQFDDIRKNEQKNSTAFDYILQNATANIVENGRMKKEARTAQLLAPLF